MNVVRNKAIVGMEFVLAFWIQDLWKKNIPMNTKMIRRKTLNLHHKFSWGNEGELQPGPSSASDLVGGMKENYNQVRRPHQI